MRDRPVRFTDYQPPDDQPVDIERLAANAMELSGRDRSAAGAPTTEPASDQLPYEPRIVGRVPGMVTVYDDRGQYLGCMGEATWRVLVTHPEVEARVLEKLVEFALAARAEAGT